MKWSMSSSAFATHSKYADMLKKKFLAEGRVLARLRHPHLIRVFDLAIDEPTGVPYFVMDIVTYKDGTPHTLDDLELGDLEEDYILGWFEDLCKALDYIHEQGIVHRDCGQARKRLVDGVRGCGERLCEERVPSAFRRAIPQDA